MQRKNQSPEDQLHSQQCGMNRQEDQAPYLLPSISDLIPTSFVTLEKTLKLSRELRGRCEPRKPDLRAAV